MSSAELSLRARVRGLRRDDVRDALWQDRSLVKTWAMRGTLHLVAASEVPELVRGLGTRLGWQSAVWLRYFKVTKQEMVALQDAIGGPAQRRADDPPGARRRARDEAGRPGVRRDRVTSSWGTFLKPAAGRGYLALRAGPRPERDVRAPGRVAGHRHPGARRRRLRCRPGPPPGGVPGRIEGRARPVVGRGGEPGDRCRSSGSATASSSSTSRARRRTCSPRTSRSSRGTEPGAGHDRPPPGRLRPVHAVAPEGGGAAAADRAPPAGVADGRLDQRGPAVRRRRRGHAGPTRRSRRRRRSRSARGAASRRASGRRSRPRPRRSARSWRPGRRPPDGRRPG